jgi:hypothetical protein
MINDILHHILLKFWTDQLRYSTTSTNQRICNEAVLGTKMSQSVGHDEPMYRLPYS